MALTAALIGGAAVLGSSAIAGLTSGRGGASGRQSELTGLQAQIAEELFDRTSPLRDAFLGTPGAATVFEPDVQRRISQIQRLLQAGGRNVLIDEETEVLQPFSASQRGILEAELGALLQMGTEPSAGTPGIFRSFLEEGTLPEALQVDVPFTAGRETLEDQFSNVRENIIGRVGARGGQLNDALIQSEFARARAVGDLSFQEALREQSIRNALLSQSLEVAFGTPPQTLNALGQAGAGFGSIAGREAGIDLEFGRGLGSAGALIGNALLDNPELFNRRTTIDNLGFPNRSGQGNQDFSTFGAIF